MPGLKKTCTLAETSYLLKYWQTEEGLNNIKNVFWANKENFLIESIGKKRQGSQ